MKKRIGSIIVALGLLLSGHSADLFVQHTAQAGFYTSISAALAACTDGDRIIIEPGLYAGSLTIDRSVQLLPGPPPAGATTPWVHMSGTITLSPTTQKDILIQGFLGGAVGGLTILSGSPPTGMRSTITVDLCALDSVVVNHANWRVRINESWCDKVRYRVGSITRSLVMNAWRIDDEVAPGEVNRAVGNHMEISSEGLHPSYYSNSHVPLHMDGNYVQFSTDEDQKGLVLAAATTAAPHVFTNNTFFYGSGFGDTGTGLITYSGTADKSLFLLNDLFIYDIIILGPAFPAVYGVSADAIVSDHCMESTGFAQSLVPLIASGQTSTQLFDIITYAPPTGSAAIDAGSMEGIHLDLDNTVNDIGASGGSFPYVRPEVLRDGVARVDLLVVPKYVVAGNPFTITLDATDQ
ncbi:MAG: hypothetical protein H6591_00895 [Flavobacteriales bacterium]|nr:hypothetical protein [Flavobacteriales bacterium]